MITEPASARDHAEVSALVREVAATTFTSEKVRAAAATALGFDEVAWKQLVDLGWPSLALDPAIGGAGMGTFVQCLVHRELGARLAPSPYLASAGLASGALVLLGDDRATDLLASLGAGTRTAALVLGHGRGWPTDDGPAGLTATETPAGWIVDGRAELVLDGARADVLVVVARTADAWGLFEVDARIGAVSRTPAATVDATRALADLQLTAAPARCLRSRPVTTDEVSGLVDRMAVPLAAEMAGAAVACLEQTLEYLRTRHQFGRPIGSFQALKHRCADVAVALTVAQEMVFAAAEMVDAGDVAGLRIAGPLLLARSAEVFLHAAEEAIQLHGGVGFTDEVDVGLYYKRALVDGELLAPVADAYARLDLVRAEGAA
ncbi:acyl-CoA/acyl-ACP dehydrogenase [Nocardioides carbamazepini]|uniref:acyl-CoA dehydrogenase family protein n=1 Tax=Nocardioides carbamazepini TaxID=2854259 RepID=UPI00214A16A4|nr:acyl-CoA dehydrogenase family protein [Nocardioides carbamazepini]MCR1783676.1 acyl-CoA/acyl-ACP dehydrogenase [Nocardioides carbamazepini]